jgi:HEAT repeat protein
MKKLPLFTALLCLCLSQSFANGLPKQSVQALTKALQDSNVEVRTAAAQALGAVPDAANTAAKPLETALIASADAAEQEALVKALVAADDSSTPKRLGDSLVNPQFTWGNGAKAKAVEVIGKVGQKKVVKWLTEIVSGEQEPAVRAAAARALGDIGGTGPYLASKKYDKVQEVYVINPK